jgi:mRNA deadenylase 3'-5' endonuclease subunit Ccr4
MNSWTPWLQVLEKAFPQEMLPFLTNFDFAKVNLAIQPCM